MEVVDVDAVYDTPRGFALGAPGNRRGVRDPVRIGVYLVVGVLIVALLALWRWPVAIVFALVFAMMPLLAELTTRRRSR